MLPIIPQKLCSCFIFNMFCHVVYYVNCVIYYVDGTIETAMGSFRSKLNRQRGRSLGCNLRKRVVTSSQTDCRHTHKCGGRGGNGVVGPYFELPGTFMTKGLPTASAVETQTLLVSRYCSMASRPSSRPRPDCLKPPNGVVMLTAR